MPAGIKQRLADLDRSANRLGNFQGFLLELNLAARNPRDVQKIVDQAGEMPHLPLDNRLGPVQPVGIRTHASQQLGRISDRRQRITQFMAQHRKKFVLVPIRILKLLIQLRIVQSDSCTIGQLIWRGLSSAHRLSKRRDRILILEKLRLARSERLFDAWRERRWNCLGRSIALQPARGYPRELSPLELAAWIDRREAANVSQRRNYHREQLMNRGPEI